MIIEVEYEASWKNSFLLGSNDEPIPKEGRKYIGSMTELAKEENFISRDVTINTVMGILNRLIGDQRKLYQSRSDNAYYFRNLEDCVTWNNCASVVNEEIVYIRNTKGSNDQNSFTGMIKTESPVFSFTLAKKLWGVLFLNFEELCEFYKSKEFAIQEGLELDPIAVIHRLESLNKEKPVKKGDLPEFVAKVLESNFPEIIYFGENGKVKPISLYCSALYLQLENLSSQCDLNQISSEAGNLTGISEMDPDF